MQEWALKPEIQQHIQEIIKDISLALRDMQNTLENNDKSLLCKVEDIHKLLLQIQSTTASYYLKTYLLPYTDCYIQLLTAIRQLSQKRHGALIIIEREKSLEAYIQSGIEIQAHLTVPLLESIFYPGNSLHDGAVLVKNNHIISAANILPLSQQALTSNRKLGTRHRAAIGLSEVSDALIFVVSEETGITSFALDGTLYTFSL